MMKLYYYTTLVVFSFMLMFPSVDYDPLIDWYRLKGIYTWLEPDVFYIIHEEVKKYPDLTTDDICSLIQYESGNYCHNQIQCMKSVRSYAGAVGLLQVMPFHYKGPSSDLTNYNTNISYGIKYYHWCLQYAKGNKRKALQYYNAGPFSDSKLYRGWGSYVEPILMLAQKSRIAYNQYSVIR